MFILLLALLPAKVWASPQHDGQIFGRGALEYELVVKADTIAVYLTHNFNAKTGGITGPRIGIDTANSGGYIFIKAANQPAAGQPLNYELLPDGRNKLKMHGQVPTWAPGDVINVVVTPWPNETALIKVEVVDRGKSADLLVPADVRIPLQDDTSVTWYLPVDVAREGQYAFSNRVIAFLSVLSMLLLFVNIKLTKRLGGSDMTQAQKTTSYIAIWLLPFLGAWMVRGQLSHLQDLKAGMSNVPSALPLIEHEPAPAEVKVDGMPAFALSAHLEYCQGIPIIDWRAVDDWLASTDSAALRASALALCKRAWLLHFREALGSQYHLAESNRGLLLSSLAPNIVKATLNYMEVTHKRVATVLNGIAEAAASGNDILIVLDDEDSYYHYVTMYYPDSGEFAASAGVHIDAGCKHFVTMKSDLRLVEPVIAHEMTHSAVAYLRLPRWLDEGLAVNTEQRLAGGSYSHATAAQIRESHRQFWNEATVQAFWSGASFLTPGASNTLSYELARLIVQQMAKDWPAFTRFVLAARREDAGAASSHEHFSLDLGEYVRVFLEQPVSNAWSPSPDAW